MVDGGPHTVAEEAIHPAQQIFTVEALRGIAALSVTWFHMTNTYTLDWVRYSGFHGWLLLKFPGSIFRPHAAGKDRL